MYRSTMFIACTLLISGHVYSQIPNRIDVNSLRSSVLHHAANSVSANALSLAQAAIDRPEPTTAQTWGVEVMVVPDLFVRAIPELASGSGLLVTKVYPLSPAERLGLRKGMVLLEVSLRRLSKECELPKLDQPLSFTVLTNDGVKNAEIQPDYTWLIELARPEFLYKQLMVSNRNNLPQPACAVSMAEANGHLSISATVPTEEGNREVQLRGTRSEVESQLNKLPLCIQKTLRPQIGF